MMLQRRRVHALARSDRPGQAIVEFALIAPILLLLVLGIVEFARAWSAHHVIADAAREGARWQVVANGSTRAEVRDRVAIALTNGGLNPAGLSLQDNESACATTVTAPCVFVSTNGGGGTGDTGDPSEVYLAYPYRLIWLGPFMNFLNLTVQSNLTLRTRIVMRNE